jgi:hypothetical protein
MAINETTKGETAKEAANVNTQVTGELKNELKKKKGFWGKFATFLMMGGFIVVLIVIVGIILGVSLLFNIH